ncbi:MAG: DUF4351 domain-containing protein [Blastocatellia bacterium]
MAIYEEIDWTRKPVFLDKELHKLGPAHETGKRLADKLVVLAQLKLLETRRDVGKKYVAKLELILQLLHGSQDTEQTRDLLRFLDWLFQLPEELEEKLSYDVQAKVGDKSMPYVTSWERIAEKRGMRAVVLRMLRRQIGALDEGLKERIKKLSSARLEQLADALLDFTQPSDLERWLKRRKA